MAQGKYLPLSLGRRWMSDIMHFGKQMPLVTLERQMQLGRLATARSACVPRPSWCSLFVRACALVAAERPTLRRVYMSLPWPRLYEHPFNIANIAVARMDGSEEIVVPCPMRHPERMSVVEIDTLLTRFRTDPLERLPLYQALRWLNYLPLLLRRLIWSIPMYAIGSKRARWFGTFCISVTAGAGSAGIHLICPTVPLFWYTPLEESGGMKVRISFDHRVMDGLEAARALADLERVLCEKIVTELESTSREGFREAA